MARAFERGLAVYAELHAGKTCEEGIASRRHALRDLIAPLDSVHVLGHVMNSEMHQSPETYCESDHEGLAYVVEMVASELMLRPTGSRSPESTRALDNTFSDEVRRLTQEAMMLETLRRYRASGGFESPEGEARGRAATHHLMMRSPGWPWQEHATLRGLFGDDRFDAVLRARLGFGVEDAINCCEALPRLISELTASHMRTAAETAGTFGEGHPAFEWASRALGGWQETPVDEHAFPLTALWALNTLGDASLLTPRALGEASGVSEDVAACYIAALSQGLDQPEDDWFSMAQSVRAKPFIELVKGSSSQRCRETTCGRYVNSSRPS